MACLCCPGRREWLPSYRSRPHGTRRLLPSASGTASLAAYLERRCLFFFPISFFFFLFYFRGYMFHRRYTTYGDTRDLALSETEDRQRIVKPAAPAVGTSQASSTQRQPSGNQPNEDCGWECRRSSDFVLSSLPSRCAARNLSQGAGWLASPFFSQPSHGTEIAIRLRISGPRALSQPVRRSRTIPDGLQLNIDCSLPGFGRDISAFAQNTVQRQPRTVKSVGLGGRFAKPKKVVQGQCGEAMIILCNNMQ